MKEMECLRPFRFHGLDLENNSSEAGGDCPFCGREGKFSVNISDKPGTWRCLVCDEHGNQYTFLEKIYSIGSDTGLGELASDRGVAEETLRKWGVCKSVFTGEWLVPGYNTKGELRQLYRYVKMKDGKHKLLATPTISHGIFGIDLYDRKKQVIYLCEGPWDAMRLWEVLSTTKEKNGKFVRTTSSRGTMINGANVLAVPGCSTFYSSWKSVFLRKKVYIVYDNDHPRKHPKTGKRIPPAGFNGVERVATILGTKTKETNYLCWGPKGYDPKLPHGTDVRDFLNGKGDIKQLLGKLAPVPEEWMKAKEKTFRDKDIYPQPCDRWVTVSNQWRKALKWGFGLDTTLSVMLASAVSTDVVGDQLWIKVIGPASCGKSTLCEALSVCRSYVLAKSTIRGFHSGYKEGAADDEDNSLIIQAAGKTLITKDGDTLLQSPNLGQILSEARDIYDKTSRTHYRNKMSKEYTGINMTWILCGTSSLRSIDQSELGERFLDCVIMDGIDDDEEDEVLMRVARREDRNISRGAKGDKSNHDEELVKAMRLTGGYVEYLRDHDEELLADIETSEEYLQLIARIGKFVAFMRARPSMQQTEHAEREFAARLVSQHIRLAKCLAVVLNRQTVDAKVMERVIKVALDTSRGVTYDMCRILIDEGEQGAEVKLLSLMVNRAEPEVRRLLRFLSDIGVVEGFTTKKQGVRSKRKWRLTGKMQKLFNEVLNWRSEK